MHGSGPRMKASRDSNQDELILSRPVSFCKYNHGRDVAYGMGEFVDHRFMVNCKANVMQELEFYCHEVDVESATKGLLQVGLERKKLA